ncbi:unnamed protein product [Pleuronectes platessa]|uniref:Uncharacterized protein n=1 Tax=Pleuronectes platessa TaxID=8262 RepID=A0A9N7ZD26_PLEPL|nr:unnamed protein product [Pleuronectes platessa]
MPAAGELRCVDAAIESVLEDIDSAFILKEEHRTRSRHGFVPVTPEAEAPRCAKAASRCFSLRNLIVTAGQIDGGKPASPRECIQALLDARQRECILSSLAVKKARFPSFFLTNTMEDAYGLQLSLMTRDSNS